MSHDDAVSESEAAKNCFDQVRLRVEEIADPEYQTRVWLGHPPGEFSSYLDASAEIIDLGGRMSLIADHLTDIGLDRQQWVRVMAFSLSLKEFEESIARPYDSAEVVKHPKWSTIVSQARALLADLPKRD